MIAALSFLTIVGSGATPDHRSMRWFPLVGALIGSVSGATWWGALHLTTPLLAATLAVATDVILTGMLHLDGLADSADGLLPHMPLDKRLRVMTEPTTGAFGFTVVAMTLLLRVAAISSITDAAEAPARSILVFAGLWAIARSAMVLVALRVPYARPGGIASMFVSATDRAASTVVLAALGIAAGIALGAAALGWLGFAAGLAAVGAGAGVVALSTRRLGGYTGDVLGALGVVAETVGLIVAALSW